MQLQQKQHACLFEIEIAKKSLNLEKKPVNGLLNN